MPVHLSTQNSRHAIAGQYELLDMLQVRSPLFPVEAYLALGQEDEAYGLEPRHYRVQRALAVGSLALLDELERTTSSSRDRVRSKQKLLQYLIRMTTRPTPYGLFAGVGLARFGAQTDLSFAENFYTTHTRPDMAWLLQFVRMLENQPEVRKHLRFVANTAAHIRRGRIFLLEPLPGGVVDIKETVSIRATGVARRALSLSRQPILYPRLVEALLASTPGATLPQVEKLITTLWEHSLLVSDLRPPLTLKNPVTYLQERLAEIPPAIPLGEQLSAYLEAMSAWDASEQTEGASRYRTLTMQARQFMAQLTDAPMHPSQTPGMANAITLPQEQVRKERKSSVLLQVDTALHLATRQLSEKLQGEIAHAVELMLRLSPLPEGFRNIQAYRQAFLTRYGEEREVPLLELLDTQFGLGITELAGGRGHNDVPGESQREQELSRLALDALYERQQVVHLSEENIKRLETASAARALPTSLDIAAFVAATSSGAVDRGDYLLVIGPNVGALQGGRTLGRFAHMLGEEARQMLTLVAEKEAALEPGSILAELVYQPRDDRMMNVTVRPATRNHEILYGVMPGVGWTQVIPLDELVVGIRDGRFYVRWLTQKREVRVCAGHMLNTVQAPAVVKFLSEIGQDQVAVASNFHWGNCAHFPFLPRVQVGRLVLALARWRISSQFHLQEFALENTEVFLASLERWRAHWNVPRYIYLSQGDNRLLLDLTSPTQAEELRAALRSLKHEAVLVFEEALPGPEHAWMPGPGGHYLTEFVFSLVRRGQQQVEVAPALKEQFADDAAVTAAMRSQSPGSEWLFAKLYCAPTLQEELIAGPLRLFVREMLEKQFARDWFFIRYADPDPHIRLRFQGDPQVLMKYLLPELCHWGSDLMREGACLKFVFDVYEREIERYGGSQCICAAEALFSADSTAVMEMLYLRKQQVLNLDPTILAVLSIDALLLGLGLSTSARLAWCRQIVPSARKTAGAIYRQKSLELRTLLGDALALQRQPGGEQLAALLAARRISLERVTCSLSAAINGAGVTQPLEKIYGSFVHMHCNRLLGIDRGKERQVVELLLRTLTGLEKNSSLRS